MSGLKGSLWRKRKAKSVQNTIFLHHFSWQCWLIFHQNLGSIVIDQYEIQELFAAIDKEDDGIVYLQDVVVHLRALNEDIDKNLKVKVFLDELDTNGTMEVDFKRFCVNHFQFKFTWLYLRIVRSWWTTLRRPDGRRQDPRSQETSLRWAPKSGYAWHNLQLLKKYNKDLQYLNKACNIYEPISRLKLHMW